MSIGMSTGMGTGMRMSRTATLPLPLVLPGDVRLMNAVSALIYIGTAVALVLASVLWFTRSPWLAIRGIQLEGEITRNTVGTLRANAAPRVAGNFFSVDLQRSRAAFEAVPWVRHAVVRRVWPDQLVVHIEEHHPVALWQGNDRGDQLVNEQGEVFDANAADVEELPLPLFSGPEGSAAQMLSMYRSLAPALKGLSTGSVHPQSNSVDSFSLSGRGSWRVVLGSGAVLELGRGSPADVLARTQRFVGTAEQVRSKYDKPLEYADLRHKDGYVLRLRGVSTTGVAAGAPATPLTRITLKKP